MEAQDRTNYYTIEQHGKEYNSRRESRYTPYPPQSSLHKLKLTYLDPDYVADLVEMIKPRPFGDALAAVLEGPQRGRGVLDVISEFFVDLKRGVAGEARRGE